MGYLVKDPDALGKPGIFKCLYRYLYGDYRVIYAIERQGKTINILRVGIRREMIGLADVISSVLPVREECGNTK
ncbi:MAG: type II toxin-antitoxin system RelE/ParE family toxin [Proteobacteria bacterium]|nr:type II toxin-antitoxin system RelE/ParE family toxin [Pseudomonadota bacterium]